MSGQRFIVTGAKRNDSEFSMENLAGSYQSTIYEIDFDNESIVKKYVEESPDWNIYPEEYSFSFRGCTLAGDVFYTCNHSEILKIDKKSFNVIDRISSTVFNDLHHVDLINGKIAFASTGIDHIGFWEDGEVELHSVLPEGEGRVLDKEVDYRKISTKPHMSHPNYIFEIDGKTWITRFQQKDAICLEEPDKRMDIGFERPHDGLVVDGKVYFTTVNGSIVIFDAETQEKLEVHDLQSLYSQPKIGWCRGIEVVGDYAYVGLSRVRKTRSLENLGFIADGWNAMIDSVKKIPPARIVKYDLKRRKIIKEMNFKNSQLSVLFSIKAI